MTDDFKPSEQQLDLLRHILGCFMRVPPALFANGITIFKAERNKSRHYRSLLVLLENGYVECQYTLLETGEEFKATLKGAKAVGVSKSKFQAFNG